MSENGYVLPDELEEAYKADKGTSKFWRAHSKALDRLRSKTQAKQFVTYSSNDQESIASLNRFIINAGGQVKKLYSRSVSDIKKGLLRGGRRYIFCGRESGRMASSLTFRDIKNYYLANKQKFKDIVEEDIDASSGRFGGNQPPRDVQGAILLSMIETRFPEVENYSSIPSHWQKIWGYYNNLKKGKIKIVEK